MAGLNLERGAGFTLWRQIEAVLEDEIAQGAHPPGARLPTEVALATRFSVNRHTIRRAMAGLAERGLLRVEQGRGTFVQEHMVDYPLGRRTRFSENVARAERAPGDRLLRALTLPASPEVAEALAIAANAPVVMLETLGEADGRPLGLGAHHFPAARFLGLIRAYEASRSISRALAACGVPDYTRKLTRITVRMPSADEARILQQPANRPVLVTEAVNVDAAGAPIEYGVARFAGDRVQLVVEEGS
ncbi:MAG: phosphonate metabolism transcriptional regulator PhnF [Alphaproteobacteria bacterium]|nr:phosphonate metabolism transcriptional regulator PhnF [Alphaproteobacteria bacterium]